MSALQQALEVHGPLGILALVGIMAAAYMYRELKRERKQHREEINQLVDRILVQGGTQNEKYHQLADKLNAVVEAAMRRRLKE